MTIKFFAESMTTLLAIEQYSMYIYSVSPFEPVPIGAFSEENGSEKFGYAVHV